MTRYFEMEDGRLVKWEMTAPESHMRIWELQENGLRVKRELFRSEYREKKRQQARDKRVKACRINPAGSPADLNGIGVPRTAKGRFGETKNHC